jgi:ATP-dependent protease ClpP protease subunit
MKVRSMKGEVVNFANYMEENAHMPAIGNARLNAQGDVLDKDGKIIKTRADIAAEYHRNTKSVKQVSIKALDTEMFQTPAEAMKKLTDDRKPKAAEAPKRKLSDD